MLKSVKTKPHCVVTVSSLFQTLAINQFLRLQGVKHHTSVDELEEEEEDVLRDEFSIHKMVVMITEPGKVCLQINYAPLQRKRVQNLL